MIPVHDTGGGAKDPGRSTARRPSDRDHGVVEARWTRREERYAEMWSLSKGTIGAEVATCDPPQQDRKHLSWQYHTSMIEK